MSEELTICDFELTRNETQPSRIKKCTIQLTALTNELPGSTHLQPKVAEIHYPCAMFSPWPPQHDAVINHGG